MLPKRKPVETAENVSTSLTTQPGKNGCHGKQGTRLYVSLRTMNLITIVALVPSVSLTHSLTHRTQSCHITNVRLLSCRTGLLLSKSHVLREKQITMSATPVISPHTTNQFSNNGKQYFPPIIWKPTSQLVSLSSDSMLPSSIVLCRQPPQNSICLSIRFYNSCRRLPDTKRHSSLFLHWFGSQFLVVMAACTPSIHVFLGRTLFLLSSGIHSIINFVILSSGILLTWPYHCSLFFSMMSDVRLPFHSHYFLYTWEAASLPSGASPGGRYGNAHQIWWVTGK